MGRNIAIIPARSGSKRIPKKNIVQLAGKPMIVWTIEAALQSNIFSDVLVSTDGDEIAEISKKAGAVVPFMRDSELADDHTPVGDATISALLRMEEFKKIKYDIVVQLMPNCPCRTAADITDAYHTFLAMGADFQISIFQFGWMNPWWARQLNEKTMETTSLFPEATKKRSQDLDKLYCPTGAIWIAKADPLKREKTFYGKRYKTLPISWQSAIDIDNMDDLAMAEAVMSLRKK